MIFYNVIKRMGAAMIKITMDMKKKHIKTIITKKMHITRKINTMMRNNTSRKMINNKMKNSQMILISINKKNRKYILNMKDLKSKHTNQNLIH